MAIRVLTSLTVVAVVLLGGLARAGHNEPGKGKVFSGGFVTAYDECTAPSVGAPPSFPVGPPPQGCTPPVRSDPGCGFGPDGVGRFRIRASRNVLKTTFLLTGLDPGCEGEALDLRIDARSTLDGCVGPVDCTLTDFFSGFFVSVSTCNVEGGRCAGGLATIIDPLGTGTNNGIEIRNVRVTRGLLTTFVSGVRVP